MPPSGGGRLASRPEHFERFIEEFGHPNLGFCLDTGHALVNGLNPASEARAAGDRLIATHLQDTDGVEDRHWVPGAGRINWEELTSTLREIDYPGLWTFELNAPAGDPASMAAAAHQVAMVWGDQAAATSADHGR